MIGPIISRNTFVKHRKMLAGRFTLKLLSGYYLDLQIAGVIFSPMCIDFVWKKFFILAKLKAQFAMLVLATVNITAALIMFGVAMCTKAGESQMFLILLIVFAGAAS